MKVLELSSWKHWANFFRQGHRIARLSERIFVERSDVQLPRLISCPAALVWVDIPASEPHLLSEKAT